MKKLCLCILFVLLLPVTSSFAATVTGQLIFIPYATVGNGWWSGVAIHNTTSNPMTFSIGVFKENGDWVNGGSFSVAAHAMKVDVLENFLGGTPPSLRMSVRISTLTNETFRATLFVGSDTGGFNFQNYKSDEHTFDIL
jgi:hypothetical protein